MTKIINFIALALLVLVMPTLAGAEQYLVFSEQCPAGNEEAQKLFKQAQDKRFGRGMIVNLEEAVKLYNEAAKNGSARALYDLGTLYELRPIEGLDAEGQEKVVLDYYTQASAEGCPEGTYKLHLWAEHQLENAKQNLSTQAPPKRDESLLEAANAGALVAMFELGRQLLHQGELEKGSAWLQRALSLGYGDAADALSRMQFEQKNMREGISLLRQGARLGSIACLHRLSWIYSRGQYNQMRDPEYAQCFAEIIQDINPDAPPELVADFDELCPPHRVFAY